MKYYGTFNIFIYIYIIASLRGALLPLSTASAQTTLWLSAWFDLLAVCLGIIRSQKFKKAWFIILHAVALLHILSNFFVSVGSKTALKKKLWLQRIIAPHRL